MSETVCCLRAPSVRPYLPVELRIRLEPEQMPDDWQDGVDVQLVVDEQAGAASARQSEAASTWHDDRLLTLVYLYLDLDSLNCGG